MRSNGVVNYEHKTFDNLWENKGNDNVGWLLLESLDELTKEKNGLHGKISQLLPAQNTMEDNNRLRDKIIQFQKLINNLKIHECVLKENIFSSSHKAQIVKNQTEALIISLAEVP